MKPIVVVFLVAMSIQSENSNRNLSRLVFPMRAYQSQREFQLLRARIVDVSNIDSAQPSAPRSI